MFSRLPKDRTLERVDEKYKKIYPTHPAPAASTAGSCPTICKSGRTLRHLKLPSTIAQPNHPVTRHLPYRQLLYEKGSFSPLFYSDCYLYDSILSQNSGNSLFLYWTECACISQNIVTYPKKIFRFNVSFRGCCIINFQVTAFNLICRSYGPFLLTHADAAVETIVMTMNRTCWIARSTGKQKSIHV